MAVQNSDMASWVLTRSRMRRRSCPRCGNAALFLRDESRNAEVDYYHCAHCGESWLVDPMNPTKPLRSTPPERHEANDRKPPKGPKRPR